MAFPSRLQAGLKAKSKKVAKELADPRMAQKMSGHRLRAEKARTRDRRSIHGTSQDRVVWKAVRTRTGHLAGTLCYWKSTIRPQRDKCRTQKAGTLQLRGLI